MNASEFFTLCEQHDWYYYMSDDPTVYQRGYEHEQKIRAALRVDEAEPKSMLYDIYAHFVGYFFKRTPFEPNGELPAKPTRAQYGL